MLVCPQNEMISDTLNVSTYKDNLWTQKFGEDALPKALMYARAADPSVKLYYNDYAIEAINNKSDTLYNLVKSFKKDGKFPLPAYTPLSLQSIMSGRYSYRRRRIPGPSRPRRGSNDLPGESPAFCRSRTRCCYHRARYQPTGIGQCDGLRSAGS